MEAFIEIYPKGSKTKDAKKLYYHLWIKDNDGMNTKEDFWDLINGALKDMEREKHTYTQSGFPNFAELRAY